MTFLPRILTFFHENPAKSAAFSANLPLKIPRNFVFFSAKYQKPWYYYLTENQCCTDKLFRVPIHIIYMLLSDTVYASYNVPQTVIINFNSKFILNKITTTKTLTTVYQHFPSWIKSVNCNINTVFSWRAMICLLNTTFINSYSHVAIISMDFSCWASNF